MCHTIQHRAVLIIFPLYLQTIAIARVLSIAEGRGYWCYSRSIIVICGQIEGILWDTCTGTDERLQRYYAFWEAKIYRALTNMVVSNLQRFIAILSAAKPLCKIFALVVYPEIVISPSPIEVIILRSILYNSSRPSNSYNNKSAQSNLGRGPRRGTVAHARTRTP